MTNTNEVKAEAKRLAGLYMAIAEGRTLQYLFGTTVEGAGSWCDVACLSVNDILYIASTQIKIRIKPEPQLVPWTELDVPIGGIIRSKENHDLRGMIVGVSMGMLRIAVIPDEPLARTTSLHEWKWPHEPDSAWKACGITKNE